MVEMLSHSFMQRALIMGLMVAVLCPAVGVYLVLRRQAQYGDTLSHVSLVGVAAGVLIRAYPEVTGLTFSVIASLGIDWLRQRYAKYGELSLAIMAPASLALAVVVLDRTGRAGVDVMGYLFGSLLTVTQRHLLLVGGLSLVVLAVLLLLYKELLAVSFDEDLARISGLPVGLINVVFMAMTAMTVAMAMSVVGVLLVSALIVVPAATALQLARSFRSMLSIAVGVGLLSVLAGVTISYQLNLMTGATVALTAVAILLLTAGYRRVAGLE